MFSRFKQRDRTTWRHYGLFVWGALLSILGGIGTISFLREIQHGEYIPLSQLATRLLLPHVALLTGLGLVLASIILLRKQAVMRDRQKQPK